jgi:outer membrane protein OmpA-like peptidoglycan-associated protein
LAEGDVDYELPHTIYLTYKKTFLTVVGYADKNENNKLQLSALRAKLIYDLLLKKGLEAKRICYAGKGDQLLIRNQEFDYEGRIQSNSKIELQISKTACNQTPIK